MARSLRAGRRVAARARRPVRRRRRRQAGGERDVPPRRGATSTTSSLVDTDEICAAIKDVFEDTRSIVEPSGALAIAGAKRYVGGDAARRADGRRDPVGREHELRPAAVRRRARRARRAPRGGLRRHDPGAAGELQGVLPADRRSAASRSSTTAYADPAEAHVFVGVEVRGLAEKDALFAALAAARHPRPRPLRQRDGEAPRPAPRRRPRAAARRTSCSTASSSPSGRAR